MKGKVVLLSVEEEAVGIKLASASSDADNADTSAHVFVTSIFSNAIMLLAL